MRPEIKYLTLRMLLLIHFSRSKKFRLEYYKVKFKADWYTKIYGKLVLRTLTEFGFLGAYNQDRGVVPFERFYVGGDGLANFSWMVEKQYN
jgi:outer membrane protein assembly factor BamA